MKGFLYFQFISFLFFSCSVELKNSSAPTDGPLPECEWCGAGEAPSEISWETNIAGPQEPGEKMILEGKIYEADGISSAEGVIVYAYHTNTEGIYEKKGDETGNGKRHGYLRGWVKTNSEGQYRFHTIKPAPYPNLGEPAHIHLTLKGDDFKEYWINATWFKGDKIITAEMIKKLDRQGGFSNIIELNKNDKGILVGKRNIILDPPMK